MNSSTWRCRAVRSVIFVPSRIGLAGGRCPHALAGSARRASLAGSARMGTPSEAPGRTVTRSGVRGKHLFGKPLDGNTRSWLDPNRRSAHRVDLPGWTEPRRGAASLPGAVVRAQLSERRIRAQEPRRNCHTPVVRYGGGNGRIEKEARQMAAVMTTPRIE